MEVLYDEQMDEITALESNNDDWHGLRD